MTQISGHNLKTDTDGSIVKIDLATILQASLFSFSNVTSHDSDSSNNYMVLISAMDLTASFPSVFSNIIVSNSSTGILKIETAIGDLNPDNMLIVQNLVMSDCNVTNSFDVISLSSMFTYDPYVIMFSNLTFQNLEFLQGAHLLNLEHLLIIPVRIINSIFENIKGGKISTKSFTTEIQGVSTSIDVSNVTVQNVNVLYDSFFTLQTGAILTISYSFFSNMSCYEEGTVLYAGNELTSTTIINTVFQNNAALLGGVMFIKKQSIVRCSNCTFIRNFAVEGGIVATSDNGYFEFSQSIFDNNFATAGLIANIFVSATESIIIGSTITNNVFVDSGTIMTEISGN